MVELQSILWALADTVAIWRDVAIVGLAGAVVGLVWLAAGDVR